MGLFIKSETLETQLATSNQKLTVAETHITELEEENKTFAENVKAANDAAETARNEAQSAKEARAVAENSFAEFKKNVSGLLGIEGDAEVTREALEKAINDKAHAKALEIAASQGATAPVPTAPAAPGKSPQDLLEAYEATAPGVERTKFFRANENAIRKANAQLKASEKK